MTHRFWAQCVGRMLVSTLLAIGLAACATGPRLVSHSFSFNGLKDHWADSVDLLAYAYGDGYHMVREDLSNPSSSALANKPGLPTGRSINGPMPVGEFLFVKWRVKATGEVLEQRVDLRGRLPKNMTNREVTFVMEGPQLYVFVVTRDAPMVKGVLLKTWLSRYNHAYEIYPTK
ncbi:hypothetical protein [Hydrogenophaga crassostreae]|nr:hypothetical protein [Hydrogenophaga crassostreae]